MADKPCLHCMVRELIDEHFSSEEGEIDTIEVLIGLLDVMTEVIAASPSKVARQVHIVEITKRLPKQVAECVARTIEAGATRH